MRFDAIVHASRLRPGARLNIAEADQSESRLSAQVAAGVELHVRIGVCTPQLATGWLLCHPGQADCPSRLVLALAAEAWTLERASGGVTDPGLRSETWIVHEAIDSSLLDHSVPPSQTMDPFAG